MKRVPAAQSSATDALAIEQFASDVRYYLSLTPRQLPSRYFYDDLGSALFDAICRLPWYAITRAEKRLLASHGGEAIRAIGPASIVELGPGSGEKLRLLLDAAVARADAIDVHLVDVSRSALEAAAKTIGELDEVRVMTHQATYEAGLIEATAQAAGRTLVVFLGSNIGNFDPPGAAAFLHNVRSARRDRCLRP
jgi:L-histidine N-alpha-methyltransferase